MSRLLPHAGLSLGILAMIATASVTPVQAAVVAPAASSPVVVGYLPDWLLDSQPHVTAPVTDVILFTVAINRPADGAPWTLPADPIGSRFAGVLKDAHGRGQRVLLCLGGWEGSSGFAGWSMDPTRLQQMVSTLAGWCDQYHLDGIDLDWESPDGADQVAAYADLIHALTLVLHPKGRLVTMAMAPWEHLDQRIFADIDRVHLMCYDEDFPQATLAKVTQEIDQVIARGVPPERLVMGIPFYGSNAKRETKRWIYLAPHDHGEDVIDGFAANGPATVGAKVRLARERHLAGVMIWALGQDAPGPDSLMSAIDRALVAPLAEAKP